MSEVSLLAFGCAVSFIAVAGAYVYLREGFIASERATRPRTAEATGPVDRGPGRAAAMARNETA
jgi:hypothetical protein